ncbi:MAG: penicillin-binding protein 1A [Pseudomonadota bacterium]
MSDFSETKEHGFFRRLLSWKNALRFVVVMFILGLVALIALWAWIAALSRDLPTLEKLAEYEPPITSRVHAGDGALIAEFADQHRVFVPYESIPKHVVDAFIAAEDKKYFEHEGLDYVGILRGAINSARNKITGSGGLQGGSTITQQVAKNMLLTRDQTIVRKVKEAVISGRMERAFTKEEILELYLNEIYLGGRSYGVGSAALNYFNKSLPELDISEAAILASLAKAPSAVNPYTNPERLLRRRNYVIGRMVEDLYITDEEAEEAKSLPLSTTRRLRGPEYAAATYFVQELRRDLIDEYGEEQLEQSGLSIRTTIDTRLQLAAQEALQNGLEAYDRRKDYRGPVTSIATGANAHERLAEVSLPGGYGSWEAGLVISASDSSVRLLLPDNQEVDLNKEDIAWAKETYTRPNGGTGLDVGDVVLAEFSRKVLNAEETASPMVDEAGLGQDGEADATAPALPLSVPVGEATLRQVPEVDGALVALDPHTGRVLAMAGGYSFFKSAFNRVTQAERQPGSAFKPFVYAAALEKGYTPATQVLDAPFVDFDVEKDDFWAPGNYSEGRFYGLSTMRLGLEKSRNLMTVRMAQDIGMEAVSDLAERVGIYERLNPYLAMSLGAGETRVLDMAKGYAALVNGGREVRPTLLDRIQDRHGRTLYRHDDRECGKCTEGWNNARPPELDDTRAQVLDPIVAYQVVHMLEGVVQRGTGARAKRVGKPLAGKTGTTNEYFDATFYGFSPDLVVGVWVGFDTPKTLGEGEAGGSVAAPIFTEFMEKALEEKPGLPFRIPPGVRLVRIDARTGELPGPGTSVIIDEAFRPGTEPGVNFTNDDDELSIFSSGDASIFGTPSEPDPAEPAGEFGIGGPEAPATPEDGLPPLPGALPEPADEIVDTDVDGIY